MTSNQEALQRLIDEFVQVSHGDMARVKTLLGQHAGLLNVVASWNETPLQAAAHVGNRQIATYLLERGAPLDICTAVMLGMKDKVVEFLRAKPSLANSTGSHGIPVLYYAAISGLPDIAELLIRYGAAINSGEGVMTALHGAASFGQLEMVRWLLNNGADPGALNYDGKTPFDLALRGGYEEIAGLLRQRQKYVAA